MSIEELRDRIQITDFMTLYEFTELCGDISKASGFHEFKDTAPGGQNDYIIRKLFLIVSELTEAMDELRSGRSVDEVYVSEGGKPEGFSVEIIDALVRISCLINELGIYAPAIAEWKLLYNTSRPAKHGREF